MAEKVLCWVTATCFQSTHPHTFLKSGKVTVSKRETDMSMREVCGVRSRVWACVFVGPCGVRGSVWQWVHLLCIPAYTTDTNKPTHSFFIPAQQLHRKGKFLHLFHFTFLLFISLLPPLVSNTHHTHEAFSIRLLLEGFPLFCYLGLYLLLEQKPVQNWWRLGNVHMIIVTVQHKGRGGGAEVVPCI